MKVFKHIKDLQLFLKASRNKGFSLSFVPTMGALHKGHIALIEKAKNENQLVVCSIFVNPKQFNNPADLEKYPRTLEQDSILLEQAGCDILFAPDTSEMYDTEAAVKMLQAAEEKIEQVHLHSLAAVMEGAFRPGHFKGVMVVVYRLFDIVKPDTAYFGEKDFQQLAIIQQMVKQLHLPIKIIPCPTLREADGLAMSSRNTRLTPHQRSLAPAIFKMLNWMKSEMNKLTVHELISRAKQMIEDIEEMQVEYVEISDAETLEPISSIAETNHVVVCAAVTLGEIRLIDNIVLK